MTASAPDPARLVIPVLSAGNFMMGMGASMAVPIVIVIRRKVPAGPSLAPVSLSDPGRILLHLPGVLPLAFTVPFAGGTYVIYTCIPPLLNSTMGFTRDGITLVLLLFGFGPVIGNLSGGPVSGRCRTGLGHFEH